MSGPAGPAGPVGPVGPRVPKDEFMRALGLDHNNPHHEGYYRAMRVGPFLDKRVVDLKWLLTGIMLPG